MSDEGSGFARPRTISLNVLGDSSIDRVANNIEKLEGSLKENILEVISVMREGFNSTSRHLSDISGRLAEIESNAAARHLEEKALAAQRHDELKALASSHHSEISALVSSIRTERPASKSADNK